MTTARLLIDPPAAGAWNMAVDEALLTSAAERDEVTVRFYEWETPTLSLGYFQSHDQRDGHPPSRRLPLVRRRSGGGAIVHDQELTYGISMPVQDRWSAKIETLVAAVHGSLQNSLAAANVDCKMVAVPQVARSRDEPFLCFQRRSTGDLVCGDHKIAGSAQRRHRGALLQHGSVLLGTSSGAPELPGITDLTGVCWQPADLADRWLEDLQFGLNLEFMPGQLSAEEASLAEVHRARMFGNADWSRRR